MPAPGDSPDISRYKAALSEWNVAGGVVWNSRSQDYVRTNMSLSPKEIAKLMWEFVQRGGEIDAQPETREPYRRERKFHYDLRLPLEGKDMYVETILVDDSRIDPPHIQVVNIKPR